MKVRKGKKAILGCIIALLVLISVGCSSNANETVDTKELYITDENYVEYQVMDRVDSPEHVAFVPEAAETSEKDFNENITLVVERILNQDAFMLKKGTVQPVGVEEFSSWELACDEGGNNREQSAPNPLSYLTVGISSNLLTQLERGIDIMKLDVDSVKVEVEVGFRWSGVMTDDWSGYTDTVNTNIVIESNESPEKLAELQEMALNGWVAGEGLANSTEINPELIINGEHWEENYSIPGGVVNDVSVVDDFTVTQRTTDFEPETIEIGKEAGGGGMDPEGGKPLFIPAGGFEVEFKVIGIAETTDDPIRPYLQKVTVRAIQENYVPWIVYVDDSYGYEGIEKAPTSLEYLTAGIGLCLTSQLSVAMMTLDDSEQTIDDFRVEQQINYRSENPMTEDMAGYTDKIYSYVMLDSDLPENVLNDYFNLAVNMCFAGEAFLNETDMTTNMYINGKIIK